MTPSKQTIQSYIESLKSIRESLEPTDEVTLTMLADALKGEEVRGIHGDIQRKLLLLHTAQKEIEKVITTLSVYQSLD